MEVQNNSVIRLWALIYGFNCDFLGCLQISERDMCLMKLDTVFLIVCSCSHEVHCKIKFGHVRKFPCLLQRDAACSPDSREVGGGRYRDLERKPRENTGIYMNEVQGRFRPALLLGKHATGHRPPAHRVWLDWTATVPQPQNGSTLFVIEISCLSVSIAGHKNV